MNLRSTLPLIIVLLLGVSQTVQAQFGFFTNEVGAIVGPVAFQSDYGERYDFQTNSGNVGIGVGLIHHINFAYRADCKCYSRDTYWNDHFKVRTQISAHYTVLNHLSDISETNSLSGLQLRSMEGTAKVIEAGMHLEWYPFSVRDFQNGGYLFAPYVGLGAHYVTYKPEASSTLGPLGDIKTTYPTFVDRIDLERGSTIAYVGDVGARYNLTDASDLFISSTWHYYDDNYVDGLSPNNVNNRSNDWIWWFNIGYVYYL